MRYIFIYSILLKRIFLLVTSLFTIYGHAQAPKFEWAKSIGGLNDDAGQSITTDPWGNSYVTGNMNGNIGTTFIAKYNTKGDLIWMKTIGGRGNSITTDTLGNVYVVGIFLYSNDFDPGPGKYVLGNNTQDAYILKLDSSGKFQMARTFQGPGINLASSSANCIKVDDDGNIYVGGVFTSNTDFDPDSLKIFEIKAIGGNDVFICKLDNFGKLKWAKSVGSSDHDRCESLSLDNKGNIWITGSFHSSADFDPDTSIFKLSCNALIYDAMFVLNLESNGKFITAKRIGGDSTNVIGWCIVNDNAGNIYLSGNFTGGARTDFDPDGGIYYLGRFGGAFVAKFDSSINFKWVRSQRVQNENYGKAIALDQDGNSYITGSYRGTVDFDSAINNIPIHLENAGYFDVYVAKINTNGKYVWAKNIGGISEDQGLAIATDSSANIFITGFFNSTINFYPDEYFYNLVSINKSDIFIHKMSQSRTSSLKYSQPIKNETVYPNPSQGIFKFTSSLSGNFVDIEIFNILGLLIKKQTGTDIIDLCLQPNGLYIVKVTDENNTMSTFKIIKQ